MNVQTVRLDVSKVDAFAQIVRIGQCDSSGTTIRAEIFDNGQAADLDGMTAMFEMRLPDGVHYVRDSGCTVSGNVIEYVVNEEVCASAPGITDEAYFDIMDGPSVICSTARFRVIALASAHADAEPRESWDNAIDALVERGNAIMDEIEQHGIPLMATGTRGGAKLGSGLEVSSSEALAVKAVTNAQVDSVASDASPTGDASLSLTGLSYLWAKIKAAFAALSHTHAAGDIASGTLSEARGGTGVTTAAAERNRLGLGNTTGALPVANGGTGASTAAGAKENIVDGQALVPASVAATGAISGSSVSDSVGTMAQLRESISPFEKTTFSNGGYVARKNGWGFLNLDWNSFSISTSGQSILTLPDGYRPASYVNLVCSYGGQMQSAMVQTNGNVYLWGPVNASGSLRLSVAYPLAQR